MYEIEFNELYNKVVIDVVNRVLEEISEKDKKKYEVFIPNMYNSYSIKENIKRCYDNNINRIERQEIFNVYSKYLTCIKISSLCEVLIRNKLVIFNVKEGISTDLLAINYEIAVETVIQSVVYLLNKENQKDNMIEKLLYPTEDFKNIMLFSTIINDNTKSFKFDILNFASVILLLYEYNRKILKNS